MEENYINKEIDQVIVHLKDFMALEGLKKNFSQENFLAKEAFEVEISHQYLNEINRFVMEGYQLNIPSLIDFDPLFLALEKGSVLSAVELYNVADLLIGASDLIDTLEDKKDFEHLNDDALDLDPVAGLKRQLLTDLEPDYTVSDNASAKLKEIRVKKRGLERSLSSIIQTYKNRYSAYLISNTINMKNGEETLPVKTQYKNLVKGSIVAYSQTGETAFMVPYEMLEVRSRLREALEEENSEVMNILADLSTRCSKQLKALKRDYEIIMNFDRYYASFRYGGSYNGSIAEQSKEYLSLNSLFHPLLQTTKIITNSLALGKDNPKTLLITGPNAGGKSVLIKAVALAVKMDKLGLMV
ncbi:MAG: hypothetical protein WCR67_03585, partial [Bacilli bacterium]